MSIKTGKNKKCKHCGKLFYVAKWEEEKGRYYCSNECRRMGMVGSKLSKETKKRMSEAKQGRIFTKEHRENLSKARIGIELSDKTREKIRIANSGEKSNFWKGGLSKKKYPDEWNDRLRGKIRKRDNFICQECGIHQDELTGWNKKLDVHHIDYEKTNLDNKNLISLCRDCHLKTNFNRSYWVKYFNNNFKN